MYPRILPVLCAAVFAGACATSGQLRDIRLFAERPPKPSGCEFEVYEQREPPHEYEVIGTLNLTGNLFVGERARKEMLSETVCQAGADAVILSSAVERKGPAGRVREFEAQFISFAPGLLEPAALPDLPPAEPGAIIAPRGMEWPEETWARPRAGGSPRRPGRKRSRKHEAPPPLRECGASELQPAAAASTPWRPAWPGTPR